MRAQGGGAAAKVKDSTQLINLASSGLISILYSISVLDS
jgi:hypothetical protein